MSAKDENLTAERVRQEHMNEVNQPLHWVYLGAILLGSLALMVAFIAVLGSTAG